jgi:hypothetical protein
VGLGSDAVGMTAAVTVGADAQFCGLLHSRMMMDGRPWCVRYMFK